MHETWTQNTIPYNVSALNLDTTGKQYFNKTPGHLNKGAKHATYTANRAIVTEAEQSMQPVGEIQVMKITHRQVLRKLYIIDIGTVDID